ncbi:MAG TPA: hypothetical protein VJR25_05010 [Microbacterium sp.]|uniref:hypothetical protein n=1 Tax=Microbacterium sp. TaxID=51671 RepID=UPI002B4794C7|nr:hypothetical protein [Microbacterium sp.]HKT56111.1 hypothetical protein [Microbacterium sp.]
MPYMRAHVDQTIVTMLTAGYDADLIKLIFSDPRTSELPIGEAFQFLGEVIGNLSGLVMALRDAYPELINPIVEHLALTAAADDG